MFSSSIKITVRQNRTLHSTQRIPVVYPLTKLNLTYYLCIYPLQYYCWACLFVLRRVLLESYFQAGKQQLAVTSWGVAVVSCVCQQDLESSEKMPQPRAKPCPHTHLRRAGISFFSTKLPPTHPSEAQSEESSKAPATGAEDSQTSPAHIHCWRSLCSVCPCRQEFRVDSTLLHSYLCQLYLISGIASAREIPVICVGGVCGPQKSSRGQCWPLAMD